MMRVISLADLGRLALMRPKPCSACTLPQLERRAAQACRSIEMQRRSSRLRANAAAETFSGSTRSTLLLIRLDGSGSSELNSHSRRTPERPLRLPPIGFPRPTIGAFERAAGPCPTRNGAASFPAAAGRLDVRPRAPSLPGRFPRFSRAQTKTTWASRRL
jgi:hypothetical protein